MTDEFPYPFPNDPGGQVPVAKVIFAIQLPDGRQVCYAGHATKATFEALGSIPMLDVHSPTGVAQSFETEIDWVSGTVRKLEGLPIGWAQIPDAEQPAIEQGPKEIES